MVIAKVWRSQCPEPSNPALRNAALNVAERRDRVTGRAAGVEEEHRRRPVLRSSLAHALDERGALLTDIPMGAIDQPQRRIGGPGTVAFGDGQRQADQRIPLNVKMRHNRNLSEL